MSRSFEDLLRAILSVRKLYPVRCEAVVPRSPLHQPVSSKMQSERVFQEVGYISLGGISAFFILQFIHHTRFFFFLHCLAVDAQCSVQFLISWNSLFPIKKRPVYLLFFFTFFLLWLLLTHYWMFVPN